jgi:diacylglycerol kinase
MQQFIKAMGHAFDGICYAIKKERHIRIQLIIAASVIVLSILIRIPKLHMLILLIVVFFVLILELMNTAVEKLIDKLSPHYDKDYGHIKDIVAGVALLGAILSVIVGILLLFWPIIERIIILVRDALL